MIDDAKFYLLVVFIGFFFAIGFRASECLMSILVGLFDMIRKKKDR